MKYFGDEKFFSWEWFDPSGEQKLRKMNAPVDNNLRFSFARELDWGLKLPRSKFLNQGFKIRSRSMTYWLSVVLESGKCEEERKLMQGMNKDLHRKEIKELVCFFIKRIKYNGCVWIINQRRMLCVFKSSRRVSFVISGPISNDWARGVMSSSPKECWWLTVLTISLQWSFHCLRVIHITVLR